MVGTINKHSKQQIVAHRQSIIFVLAAGPTRDFYKINYKFFSKLQKITISVIGFQLHSKRPVGGGSHGV